MLLPFENWFVYHPVPAEEEWYAPPDKQVGDIDLHAADGTPIHAWWYCRPGWQPAQGAIVYCHGNAGNLSIWGDTMQRWHEELDQAVLIFDYPGYGHSGGRPSEAGCYAAADAAYDWLIDRRHVPAKRLLICGESLGGGVAVDLASRRPHRGVVLLYTFTSIPALARHLRPWLFATWLMRNRFDNLSKIGQCGGGVYIAHGTADPLVPFEQGERLYQAARPPKFFQMLEGAGHEQRISDHIPAGVRRFFDAADSSRPG